jgi:ABC-type phosphate transport system auxiliary subunit
MCVWYTSRMADKMRVEDKIDRLTKLVEAIAEDVTRIDERIETLATKEQIISLHGQVNAIETQLRDMKHVKLQARVADLEEKVFGTARA